MKVLILTLVFAAITGTVWPQEKYISISGRIADAKTKQPLSNASIEVKARSIELISGLEGDFEFRVPADAKDDTLEISHIGYKAFRRKISDIRSPVNISLEALSIELKTITITSRKLNLKEIDKSLRSIRGNLYAYETETTNALYNLFLNYLEEEGQTELLKQCDYDLSAYDEKTKAFYREYVSPYRKPRDKKDTLTRDYSDFPAVNVAHGAAVVFCQWLTEQYNSNTGKKKFSNVKFRLPTLKEWQIAALGNPGFQSWNVEENTVEVVISDSLTMLPNKGIRKTIPVGKDVLYPWYVGYYYRRSPQNHVGCFLGNFKITYAARPCRSGLPHYDGWSKMSQTATYYPNNIGLYDVVGNVAEMIDQRGKACGGSWDDTPEESTIHSVKSYSKPNATVGFRIFMEVIAK